MAAPSSSTPSSTSTARRSFYICCGRRFSFKAENVLDAVLHICTVVVEKAVLVLGPVLICFASAIIGGLSWTFFTIILPMMQHQYQDSPYQYWILGGHVTFVVFLLYQIIFNYFMCVTTPNKGVNYDTVVREMAAVTDFAYPETPQAVESFRRDFEEILLIRMKRRQMRSSKDRQEALAQKQTNQSTTSLDTPASEAGAVTKRKTSNTTKKPFPRPKLQPTNQQVRNWMLMAPDEWGYCQRSKQPKPPRSHYDHVTKTLVLCLDHYCPWMFNAIGYFNYRYFCNFLWFVDTGMLYGACITYRPFSNLSGPFYKSQFQEFHKTRVWIRMYPMVPFATERLAISLAFMLCLAVGIAVAILGGFHLYLCLTGQTTIEFHGNWVNKRKAAKLNKKYTSPYDLGRKRNWQHVYGTQHPLLALLVPSTREPEFLPLPLKGEEGKRAKFRASTKRAHDEITEQEKEPLTKGDDNIV